MVDVQEPQTEQGRALRAGMSERRWLREVEAAVARAAVFDGVMSAREKSAISWRRALAAVAPEVPWPTFMNWRRKHARCQGATWERLLDERSPPSTSVPDHVAALVRRLRDEDPLVSTEQARTRLEAQFGEAGALSDATLRRIWAAADLNSPPSLSLRRSRMASPESEQREQVEHFGGGGGLALLVAADVDRDIVATGERDRRRGATRRTALWADARRQR